MMFVVKTIQQLEEAIGRNAQEVMIVGSQAHEILKTINLPDADEDSAPLYPIFSSLNKNFEVFELIDNNHTVEGVLCKKTNLSYL